MIRLWTILPTLAEKEWVPPARWHELTGLWPDHTFEDFHILIRWLIFIMAVIGLVIGTLWLRDHWKTRHTRPAPLTTFWSVARAMGLEPSECWLLIRIARHQKLPSPLTLMLSADTLEWHGRQYAASAMSYHRATLQARLQAIHQRLFDPPEPPEVPPPEGPPESPLPEAPPAF